MMEAVSLNIIKVMYDTFKNHHDLDDVEHILLCILKLKNMEKLICIIWQMEICFKKQRVTILI